MTSKHGDHSNVKEEIKRGTNGESKGFGFVQMEKYESQLRVLAKHIHSIGGRKCQVNVPLSKKPESYTQDLATIASSKLFIGRLQEKTSADALKEFFNKEAKKIDPKSSIIDVFVPKPFRSFAFITFSNPNVVQKLMKGDFIIDGASISVSAAAPRQALTPGYSQTYGEAQYGYEKGQFQHPPASKPESYTQDLATIASSKLFIGRLQEKTSADALKEFFNKEGNQSNMTDIQPFQTDIAYQKSAILNCFKSYIENLYGSDQVNDMCKVFKETITVEVATRIVNYHNIEVEAKDDIQKFVKKLETRIQKTLNKLHKLSLLFLSY